MSFLVVLRKMRERWLGGKARIPRRPRRRKLRFELLEDRLVPANVYTVSLLGDAGTADVADPTGHSGDIRYVIEQADSPANAGSTSTIQFSSSLSGKTIFLNDSSDPRARTCKASWSYSRI